MKIAIITAIYDSYDELQPVLAQDGVEVDWVCVTDEPRIAEGWRFVVEPQLGVHPNVAAKKPKCLPWLYTEADASIWIDGSFQVVSKQFAAEALWFARPIAQYPHPRWDCIYDEASGCQDSAKYASQPIQRQAEYYRQKRHPEHWGLWANGVIARRHTERVRDFGRMWLEEILTWSFQDQISEAPCLRAMGLRPNLLPGMYGDGRWLRYRGSARHGNDVAQ